MTAADLTVVTIMMMPVKILMMVVGVVIMVVLVTIVIDAAVTNMLSKAMRDVAGGISNPTSTGSKANRADRGGSGLRGP